MTYVPGTPVLFIDTVHRRHVCFPCQALVHTWLDLGHWYAYNCTPVHCRVVKMLYWSTVQLVQYNYSTPVNVQST
jgi:hypothetical protein